MENKYYTPDIEEFHIGFEYELLVNSLYEPLKGGIGDTFFSISKELKSKKIRVKYLNREDIESLGWKKRMGTTAEIYYLHWSETVGDHKGIWLERKGNLWTIVNAMTKLHFMQYWGEIKNKSELKKLMKQLKITNGSN